MKTEGKNRGEEGTTPVTTACPEAGNKRNVKKKKSAVGVAIVGLTNNVPDRLGPSSVEPSDIMAWELHEHFCSLLF